MARTGSWRCPGDTVSLEDAYGTDLGEWATYVSGLTSAGDLDGDGVADLLWSGTGVCFAPGPIPSDGGECTKDAAQLAYGDLDGDGANEVVGGYAALFVLPLPTTSADIADVATAIIQVDPWEGPWGSAAIADVDGDGLMDLVAGMPDIVVDADAVGGVYVFLGGASGALAETDADVHFGGGTAGESFGGAVMAVGDGAGGQGIAVADAGGLWLLLDF